MASKGKKTKWAHTVSTERAHWGLTQQRLAELVLGEEADTFRATHLSGWWGRYEREQIPPPLPSTVNYFALGEALRMPAHELLDAALEDLPAPKWTTQEKWNGAWRGWLRAVRPTLDDPDETAAYGLALEEDHSDNFWNQVEALETVFGPATVVDRTMGVVQFADQMQSDDYMLISMGFRWGVVFDMDIHHPLSEKFEDSAQVPDLIAVRMRTILPLKVREQWPLPNEGRKYVLPEEKRKR